MAIDFESRSKTPEEKLTELQAKVKELGNEVARVVGGVQDGKPITQKNNRLSTFDDESNASANDFGDW